MFEELCTLAAIHAALVGKNGATQELALHLDAYLAILVQTSRFLLIELNHDHMCAMSTSMLGVLCSYSKLERCCFIKLMVTTFITHVYVSMDIARLASYSKLQCCRGSITKRSQSDRSDLLQL